MRQWMFATRIGWLLLFFVTPALAQQGILWKIDGKGAAASYLLGTVHSEDPQVLQVADTVKPQFDKAASFTAEIDLNLSDAFTAALNMMLPDGKDLTGMLGKTRYDKCVTLLADYGIPETMARQLKPWAVMAQLSMPKPKTGEFLDRVLYDRAVQQEKVVYGLETTAEQVAVFETLSLQQQIALLDDALENYPKLTGQLQKLINLYLQRDLPALQRFSESLNNTKQAALLDRFNQSLLIDRNKRMAERMQLRLQEGNAFIAVGALHLPGDAGVLQELVKRGYRVTPVY